MSDVGTLTLTQHPETRWMVDPVAGIVHGYGNRWKGGRVGTHGYRVSIIGGRAYLHHRVVWEACIGPIPPGMVINHKNGNKLDNRLVNLEVVTSAQNNSHAYATGLRTHCVTGPKNGNYRVTPEMKIDILARLAAGETGKSIARLHGVSGKTVSRIKRGIR